MEENHLVVDVASARVELLPVLNEADWGNKAFLKVEVVGYVSQKDVLDVCDDEALVAEFESIATIAILLGSCGGCLRA